jgi:hypothetical protein
VVPSWSQSSTSSSARGKASSSQLDSSPKSMSCHAGDASCVGRKKNCCGHGCWKCYGGRKTCMSLVKKHIYIYIILYI